MNNGIGYPTHCLNVAVAFSRPDLTNPSSGQIWLTIDANLHTAGINWGSLKNHTDTIQGDLTLSGSRLPKNTGAFNDEFIRKYLRFNVVTNRSQNHHPTFMTHNSALDIVNGKSRFCLTVFPENNATPFHHDQIPPEIISPLVQILETGSINNIPQNVAYNFTENTLKHILESV